LLDQWTPTLTLLVVGALAIGGTSSLPHKPLNFEEAVDLAVSIYNSRSGEETLYRLLKAVPQPEWVSTPSLSNQELNFTIKETECLVEEERPLEECGFQEDGVSGPWQPALDTPFGPRGFCGSFLLAEMELESSFPAALVSRDVLPLVSPRQLLARG
uniref:Vipericidin n=1 Tax=Laticauda laticaudata TaxID=8630 RepID=A0A8C5RHF0_LATLA